MQLEDSIGRTALWASVALSLAAACTDATEGDVRANTAVEEEVMMSAEIPDDAPVRPFLGSYRFVGGDQERRALTDAIDGVVSDMSIFAKGIARERLTESNGIPETLTIEADGDSLRIGSNGKTNTGPLDGSPVEVETYGGNKMNMTFELGPVLVQRFSGDAKGRVNRYEIEGDRLVQRVRIYADALPKDLEYTLTYERL